MNYQHLTLEHRNAVSIVTLNRPEKANALNHDHLAEIEHCALSFRDKADCRVVVWTGAGKHFSSGADLTDPGPNTGQPLVQRRRVRIGERAVRAIYGMDQITIAAWNGAACGGGACLATAVDFRVGGESCFIVYPEIDIGVNLQWCSLPLITHLVGPARAKRLVIGGERIRAELLERWGVLDRCVPDEQTLQQAIELAQYYASKSPIAAQMIKRSVNAIVSALDASIMHMDADQWALAHTTDDRTRAAAAYMSKSEPTFDGN